MVSKLLHLEKLLASLGSVVVAYSGGVDSTVLASVASGILGTKALAVTASSPIHPASETRLAVSLAHHLGIRHMVIETRELGDPAFTANDAQRCYYCKRALFAELTRLAEEAELLAVIEGTNYDDLYRDRPGIRAAQELRVRSPLADLGIGKAAVRSLARDRGLPNWDKPPFSCLATRIPHGTPVTVEVLERIGRAEQLLAEMGLSQPRVHHEGSAARIEVADGDRAFLGSADTRQRAIDALRALGYAEITLGSPTDSDDGGLT